MERQSEQELLAIAPVETESLEGNRIYQVTGRDLLRCRNLGNTVHDRICKYELTGCHGRMYRICRPVYGGSCRREC